MFRDQGCPDCRRVSAGDCGKHGPQVVVLEGAAPPTFDAVAKQACKDALLVGRTLLTHHAPGWHAADCRCDFCEFGRLLDKALVLGWGIK